MRGSIVTMSYCLFYLFITVVSVFYPIELSGLSYALLAIIAAYSGLSIMKNYVKTKELPSGEMEVRSERKVVTCGVLLCIIVALSIVLKIIYEDKAKHVPLDNNAMAMGACWSCYIADRKVKRIVKM